MTNKGIRAIVNLINLGFTGSKFFPTLDDDSLETVISTGEINANQSLSLVYWDNPNSVISLVVYNHELDGNHGYQLQVFETFNESLETVSKQALTESLPAGNFIRSLYYPSLQVIHKLKVLLSACSYREFNQLINSYQF